MSKFQDLTGKKFGRLTVIRREGSSKKKYATWLCKCECGVELVVESYSLTSGNTKSCGCYQKDKAREANTTHGLVYTKLYTVWFNMKSRCLNPKLSSYRYYGGRGITVCDEWLKFENFNDWAINNGYRDDLTIDRINVNGNYEPSNCRWATRDEQANNMTTNRLLTYNGETHNAKEWAKIMNINYTTLHGRLRKGWDVEKILTYKGRNKKGAKNAK